MTEPVEFYEWETEIARIYREIVAEHGEDGISRQDAFDLARERILDLIADGSLKVPVSESVTAALLKADNAGGKLADKALRILAGGQQSFEAEGDPVLDMVVVLGAGHRKAYRFVTLADLERMDNLRYENVARATKAYSEEWRPLYAAWRPVLSRHATIGDAVYSGDLPPGFEDVD